MADRPGRSRSGPLVAVVGLAALLAALGALQYRWLGRVGEAERLRLRHNARSRAEAFARDFNREITRAYLHLQVDPLSLREPSSTRYAARYEDWRRRAAHADLVAAIYLAEPVKGGEPRLSRFQPEARTFTPAAWPPSLVSLRGCLSPGGATPTAELSSLMPVAEEVPALVAPVPEMVTLGDERDEHSGRRNVFRVLARRDGPPQWPITIIVLDPEVLGGRWLPALADRHLGGSPGLDYDYAVASVPRGGARLFASPSRPPGPVGEGDAAAGLLELRLDDLDQSLISTLLPEGAARRTEQMLAFHVTPRGHRSGVNPRAGGPWRLVLTQRAGSIDEVVDRTRRRSLALGLGILGVLAGAVVVILVSSHRARALGARQMEFVAGVSHELRTPLAVIRSAAENLADGVVAEDGAVRRYGAMIRDEGLRLSAMVEQVLAYAALDRRGAAAPKRPVSMADVVTDVLSRAGPALREARIAVERDVQERLPPVEGDAAALARAVSNLVSNASVHAASGGWIGVRATLGSGPAGPEVLVTVEDRGPGIDPEDLPRLFEPFFRGRQARESQAPGSGLGLAVVEGIVRAHGGRTSVRSTPAGSAFTLHLPTTDPAWAAPP